MAETTRQESQEAAAAARPGDGFSWCKDWVLLPTIVVVLGIDQLTKQLVRENLRLGESWPAEGLLRLTHGSNSGTAFGLFPNQTTLLIVASVVAIGFLIYYYRNHALPRPMLRLAIGLQLGGAVGNLVDRVRTGTVVDFIDVGWWPIFNLADSSIVVGMIVLVSLFLLDTPNSVRPESRGATDEDGDEDGDR